MTSLDVYGWVLMWGYKLYKFYFPKTGTFLWYSSWLKIGCPLNVTPNVGNNAVS